MVGCSRLTPENSSRGEVSIFSLIKEKLSYLLSPSAPPLRKVAIPNNSEYKEILRTNY